MSNNKSNSSFQNTENNDSKNIQNEEEIIIKYTDEIKNEETRSEAIKYLYKNIENNRKIAIYLWYTRGTMAALLQEIISTYQYLSPSKLTNENSDKAKYIISLFQNIALNPKTRKEFLESQLLVFLYPFLKCSNKTKSYEIIRVSALGVIAALVKFDDSDTINFLIKTGIIPVILRIMEKGKELIRAVTSFIVQRIIVDINGLKYICEIRQRLYAIIYVLETILQNNISLRIVKNILKIYLRLIENKEAKKVVKLELPQKIRDINFIKTLDESSRDKVYILLKSLDEDESGEDIKIKKLKNDLTNKNNNNIQNINVIRNNYTDYNNINNIHNQMNLNNVENNTNASSNNTINTNNVNNNNLNLMLLNNMQGFMISPPVGEFNYNIYNDNDNYMNQNIYNQNLNNGFGNMNYFNTFNNNI